MTLSATLHFTVRLLGLPVRGRFHDVRIQGALEPERPEAAAIDVRVQVRSISTGIAKRDRHLMQPRFFDADRYPEVRFGCSQVEATGANGYVARGSLTVKGHTEPLELPFSLRQGSDHWHARGSTRLNRLRFGIGGPGMILGRWVRIDYDLAFSVPPEQQTSQ